MQYIYKEMGFKQQILQLIVIDENFNIIIQNLTPFYNDARDYVKDSITR